VISLRTRTAACKTRREEGEQITSPKHSGDLGMHLCTCEDPLTVNAGAVIKGLTAITDIAAKASHMNKFNN